ncbi:SCO1664 family protein [Solicola gregarius]|uniref:SCO1664 family protein n=1 Tax=Solicola gregarius TaxID=2908642 RepID=A0AA46YLM6_9ACTN|nr:SCO1664 family protein [Solicola gregarius]UYM05023.1 SCO1664 family protein [Solicola gregarius]
MTDVAQDVLLDVLEHGELDLTGRLVNASNGTFLADVERDGVRLSCVYKPVRGERPLWDFPDGTLAGREVAAYLISEAAGWTLVPPTVMRDGPFGAGMAQLWVDVSEEEPVDVVAQDSVPAGWLHVLDAYDQDDRPVALVHEDTVRLRRMAVFDIVINNADRKGGHVLPDGSGGLYGCDHGVSLHVEHKLRTVLWGWAGEAVTADECESLAALRERLGEPDLRSRLCELITVVEYDQVIARIDRLLRRGILPYPGGRGPSIPWPAF